MQSRIYSLHLRTPDVQMKDIKSRLYSRAETEAAYRVFSKKIYFGAKTIHLSIIAVAWVRFFNFEHPIAIAPKKDNAHVSMIGIICLLRLFCH